MIKTDGICDQHGRKSFFMWFSGWVREGAFGTKAAFPQILRRPQRHDFLACWSQAFHWKFIFMSWKANRMMASKERGWLQLRHLSWGDKLPDDFSPWPRQRTDSEPMSSAAALKIPCRKASLNIKEKRGSKLC
jgi:hypothetical protein